MEKTELTGKILVICGPSGGGKSTLVTLIFKFFKSLFTFSVSTTTRSPRKKDIAGTTYNFCDYNTFFEMVHKKFFLEWQMVYEGVFYGTSVEAINKTLESGATPILDIDVKGAENLKQRYKDKVIVIFISLQKNVLETLRDRLVKRQDTSEETIDERLKRALFEIDLGEKIADYVVYNNKETTREGLWGQVRPILEKEFVLQVEQEAVT
ncbi:MAG TPA: hypothetical protein VGE63_03135 [Candidatus Paceibacterota bacterium]